MMDLRKKQRAVVDALEDVKGHDIVVYNTAALPSMFERVIIASGDSTRQVKALADNVRKELEALGERVYGMEGAATGEWILVDLGDMVVHVMHPTVRSFYNLEEIWGGKSVKMQTPKMQTPKPKTKPVPPKPARRKSAKPKPRGKAPRRRGKR
jgi:ribosome-associated protein